MFLFKTNGLSMMGDIILGIHNILTDKKYTEINLENTCIFEHFEANNPMPLHLVPFCPNGYGNHYCFDLHNHNIVF
ncbi:SMI1/KNR4 family protein [Barnesiella propionica]|uniref:SMI1/KNR4 family protein n=1 Tax=Barnesiella propionica TaxID=2981781 RepID=UPI00374D1BF0